MSTSFGVDSTIGLVIITSTIGLVQLLLVSSRERGALRCNEPGLEVSETHG